MCDPVMGTMAVISVLSAHQQQEAAMAQAEAQNDAFVENQALQNEAYTKDMEMYWDEEINIQKQAYQNAEDAVEAKLDMMIQKQEQTASLQMANYEAVGGGQSPDRQLGLLRRQLANDTQDLDQQYQRGVRALKGESKKLQNDKIGRRNNARGAINSMQRNPGMTAVQRQVGLFGAGASGAAAGYGKYKKPGGDKLTGGSTSGSGGGFGKGSIYSTPGGAR